MKRLVKFITLLIVMILSLLCFAVCKSNSQTGSENESIQNGSVTSQGPTLLVESIKTTYNSMSFVIKENDPQNVGEIKQIYINRKDENPIYATNSEQREFLGLYSGSLYYLNIIYEYDIGNGVVSETVKRMANTSSVATPEYRIELSFDTYDSVSFDVIVSDPSEISEITAIELISSTSSEKIVLDNLGDRTITGLKPGKYSLEVTYKYDLHNGKGWIFDVAKETVLIKGAMDIADFIVEVPENRDPVILQLSDPQIIDAGQMRPGRGGVDPVYWGTDKLKERLLDYLNETIEATKPDLIIITGDIVYGEFDDKGTSLIALIEAMESFGIPWAPVFGNHDNESTKGVDWQCDRLEEAEHCLFLQRTLTGNGNYTVGISQGGVLTRLFFMMDSNGCAGASAQSRANGHTKTSVGFGDDQIAWFESVGKSIKEISPETKISFAFHIQLQKFADAYKQYGFTNSGTANLPINIDTHPNKKESDFGFIGANLKTPWDTDNTVYNKMIAIGCDSIYVGHQHANSASVVYEGVRFQFAQKISTYDRCNWRMADGSIKTAYPDPGGDPIMGGTVNVLSNDGTIKVAYIYYCGGISISDK